MSNRKLFRVNFDPRIEQSAQLAERAQSVSPRPRRVVADGRTYVSYDADHLISALSEADMARPGFLSAAPSATRPRRTHGTHNSIVRIYP